MKAVRHSLSGALASSSGLWISSWTTAKCPLLAAQNQGGLSIIAGCISIHASCQGHSHLLSVAVLAHIKEDLVIVVIVSHHESGYVFNVSETVSFCPENNSAELLYDTGSPLVNEHNEDLKQNQFIVHEEIHVHF